VIPEKRTLRGWLPRTIVEDLFGRSNKDTLHMCDSLALNDAEFPLPRSTKANAVFSERRLRETSQSSHCDEAEAVPCTVTITFGKAR